MSRYAENTSVPTDKSRAEIERILQRYGATGFLYGWQSTQAVIQFDMHDRRVRFILDMPDPYDRVFTHTPTRNTKRSDEQRRSAWEQAIRQRWRALALVVKAKLEAVEAGIAEFQDEFLAHIVLPSGDTVGSWMRPQIDQAYRLGEMPLALPGTREATS